MKGACLFGAVEFELNKDLVNMYQCHCEQCRKQTGTASSCGTVVEVALFNWLSGEKDIGSWGKVGIYIAFLYSLWLICTKQIQRAAFLLGSGGFTSFS